MEIKLKCEFQGLLQYARLLVAFMFDRSLIQAALLS